MMCICATDIRDASLITNELEKRENTKNEWMNEYIHRLFFAIFVYMFVSGIQGRNCHVLHIIHICMGLSDKRKQNCRVDGGIAKIDWRHTKVIRINWFALFSCTATKRNFFYALYKWNERNLLVAKRRSYGNWHFCLFQ